MTLGLSQSDCAFGLAHRKRQKSVLSLETVASTFSDLFKVTRGLTEIL